MKNKLKNKKIAIVIAILAILIIGVGIFFVTNKNDNVVSEPGTEAELPDSVYYVPEGNELTEERLQKAKEYMNTYDDVLIRYQIFEDVYDENELFIERNYLTEYASIIEVKEKKDRTLNTHLLYDEDGNFDDSDEGYQKAKMPFKEAFGFDYKQYDNVYDFVCEIAKMQFANPDKFIGATQSDANAEYIYENYGQSYFHYKNNSNDLISSIGEYDEIIQIDSDICLREYENNEYINFINTYIKYKKNDKIIERTYSLSMQMYDCDEEIDAYGAIEY